MTIARQLAPFSAGAVLLLALAPHAAHAQAQATQTEQEPEPTAAQTFEYRTPYKKNYLRGVLELQGFYAFGMLWYLSGIVNPRWDLGYRWDVFQRKLTTGHLSQDDNGFGTNFRGHAIGGTGYYIAMRSNRLGVVESAGIAIAGAFAWEFFGEVSEKVSLNDVIFTPLAGTSIAESFTQLAGYFDRAERTPTHRVLGTFFGPIKTLNDALDGLELSRKSAGAPGREWHEFPFELAFAAVHESGSLPAATSTGELRLAVSERLARLPDYARAGNHDYSFDDAQLSGIAVRAAFSQRGLSDFLFEPHAVMAGYYFRSASGRGESLRGTGYATGMRVGFTYQVHDYRRGQAGQPDFEAFVEPLGWFLESRSAFGRARLRVTLDAGPEYGGIHPIAFEQYPTARVPETHELNFFKYYFGAGGRTRGELALRLAGFHADAGLAGWLFSSVDDHTSLAISDGYARFFGGVGYGSGDEASLRAFVERTERFGRMGTVRADARELVFGAQGIARF